MLKRCIGTFFLVFIVLAVSMSSSNSSFSLDNYTFIENITLNEITNDTNNTYSDNSTINNANSTLNNSIEETTLNEIMVGIHPVNESNETILTNETFEEVVNDTFVNDTEEDFDSPEEIPESSIIKTILNLILEKISFLRGDVVEIGAQLSYENTSPILNEAIDFYVNLDKLATQKTNNEGTVTFLWNTSKYSTGGYEVTINYSGNENLSTSFDSKLVIINEGERIIKENISENVDGNITFNETTDNATFNPILNETINEIINQSLNTSTNESVNETDLGILGPIGIMADSVNPAIEFISPTFASGTTTSNTSVEINVSIVESNLNSLTYNWNGTNYTMYNNSLILMYNFDEEKPEIIKATFSMTNNANAYHYEDITSVTDYVIQSGDVLEYDILWTGSGDKIAVDYTTSDSSTLRDSGAVDQNGISPHPNTDISAYALDKWYHRNISLIVGHVGETIQNYDIVCESDSTGTYTAYLDNIVITDGSGNIRKTIYTNSNFSSSSHLSNSGSLSEMINSTSAGTANDSSLYYDNATIINAEWTSDGKYGNALLFNGINSKVVANKTLTISSEGTMSAWVYANSFPANNNRIIGSVGNVAVQLIANGANHHLAMILDGGSTYESNFVIPTNQWLFVTATFDSSNNLKFYVNGSLVNTTTGTFSGATFTPQIGWNSAAGIDYWNGTIDEVRIWNRSLTADEVYQQYASNLNKFNITQWYLYVNQSKNATTGLDSATYTYQTFVTDTSDNQNQTEERTITIEQVAAQSSIGLTTIYPTENINVYQNTFFNISVNVSCLNGNCGEINVSLDPIDGGICSGDYTNETTGDETCSDQYDDAHPCSATSDGATDVNWLGTCSGSPFPTPEKWVYGDLGEKKCFNAINVYLYDADAPQTMAIYTSDDEVTWTKVYDSWTVSDSEQWVTLNIDETAARYVRFNMTSCNRCYCNFRDFNVQTRTFSTLTKSGLVNTTVGATPFYTNTSNPYNLTLTTGQSELITWWVNATGTVDTDYEYYIYANLTSNQSINNITSKWNVTILTAPDLTYPSFSNYTDNNGTLNNSGTGLFNVTIANNNGTVLLDINSENVTATNISATIFNANYTFTTNGTYSYKWHAWGSGTSNNYNFSSTQSYVVNYVESTNPQIVLTTIYPLESINVTQNDFFNVTVNISCNGANCGEINVSLDPASSTVYNFTTCGATGRSGPSQANCDTNYTGTTLAGLVTVGGGIQNWTVPVTGTYNIVTAGAQGGIGTATYSGGLGAVMNGTFELTAGQVIQILVGQAGENWTDYKAGGGGGGSFVVLSNNTPLIVAGGGGAGGGNSNPANGQSGLTNTTGGTGSQGVYAGGIDGSGGSASSGTFGGAGFNGNGGASSCTGAAPLSFLNGGTGGQAGTCTASGGDGGFGGGSGGEWCCQGACGAGGGYSGGGGTDSNGVAGGGGSYNSGTNQNNATGTNTGDGYVSITFSSSIKSGLVSTNTSATPFYTNITNPYNLTLNENESQLITWWVNATGDIDTPYEFFVYANKTSNLSINNVTSKWNVTILDLTAPIVNITYPTATTYDVIITNINYTYSDTNSDSSSCWYSTDGGATNSSASTAGINFTGLSSSGGENTWNIYCNDSSGNIGSDTITFTSSVPVVGLELVYPLANINVSQNEFFNVTVTVNCSINDCGEVNVTLDPEVGTFYNFTTCGASGVNGPTQTNCTANYTGTTLAGLVTINTNGYQEFTVPATGTYLIGAYGASGGIQPQNTPVSQGAFISGNVTLTAGTKLIVVVGQVGASSAISDNEAGAGGGTFVTSGNDYTTASPLIIAGGGSGAGSDSNGGNAYTLIDGIGSGCTLGGACTSQNDGAGFYFNNSVSAGAKSFRNGATGGTSVSGSPSYGNGGFGGGGGGTNEDGSGGGGFTGGIGADSVVVTRGGSSFINITLVNLSSNTTTGYSGDGKVFIQLLTKNSKAGIISTNSSATPFYTNVTNPYNWSLDAGDSKTITWWVNATGEIDVTHEFYVYANKTSNLDISDKTIRWNVTIKDLTSPVINITYPTATTYATSVTQLNYSYSDKHAGYCWHSLDNGTTNSTAVSAGINFTDVSSVNGANNTLTLYCNDSSGNINSSTVEYLVELPEVSIVLVNPTSNANVTQNDTFSFSAKVSCLYNDCGAINVSLDPATDRTTRTCSGVWGASCVGADPSTSDYSYDNCAAGSYYSSGFWVDQVYVDATTVAIGDNITITCDYDCYSSSNLNDIAIMYYNGTWNKLWNQDDACIDGNYSVSVIVSGEIGEQYARCSIGYNNYPNDGAADTCFDTTYSDNDDVNFTVVEAGKGGLVSTVVGDTPFYTTTQNPYPITLNQSESETVTWIVNTTGSIDDTYEFFAYANQTSSPFLSGETAHINLTIVNFTVNPISIVYPLGGNSFVDVTIINYTLQAGHDLQTCWYSTDDGTTNSANVSVGVNFTGLSSDVGSNTWTVYCNDSNDLTTSRSVTFSKVPTIGLTLISPLTNINVTQNETFTVSASVSCNGFDCGEINVSLDPVSNPISCKEILDYGQSTGNGTYTIYPFGNSTGISAYCDMDTAGGGWTLIFGGKGSTTTYANTWSGWFSKGNTVNLSDKSTEGKSKAYDYVNFTSIMLETAHDSGARIIANVTRMYDAMINLTGPDPGCNNGNTTWDSGLRGTYTSDTRTGTFFLNDWIKIWHGDGSSDCNDKAVFSTDADGDGDFAGHNNQGVIGGESRTSDSTTDWFYVLVRENTTYSSSTKSGLISMNTSATPFYTTTQNPYNLSLNAGESQTITWTINSTGELNATHDFFIYANWTSDQSISNITNHWNVTILQNGSYTGVDTTAPVITFTLSNNSYSSDNGLDINYTISESNLSSCWYSNDTMSVNTSLGNNGNCTNITSIVWTEGQHNITIWANDSVSNNGSSSLTFTIDTTNPNGTLIGPGNDTYNTTTASQNFTINLTDNIGVKNATLYLFNSSGSLVSKITTVLLEYVLSSNIGTVVELADGVYTWFYQLFDWAENSFITMNYTVTVDATAPIITITSPENNTYTIDDTLDINYTISDFNLSSCWYSNDTMSVNTSLGNNGDCINITSIVWSAGEHNLTIWANDSGEYENFSTITFTIDKIDPFAILISPENNTFNTPAVQNFTVNLTDNVGIKNATVHIYDSLNNLANQTSTSFPEHLLSSTAGIVVNLADDNYTWYYHVFDWAGNNYLSINNTVIIDATAPVLNITSFTNNTYTTNNALDINYTVSDSYLDSCWYSNDTLSVNTTLASCTNITSVTWLEGQHNITIWANDSAGNENYILRRFTIDMTNPNATLNTPENNTYVSASAQNLTVNLTDNIGVKNVTLYVYNSSGNLINQTANTNLEYVLSSNTGIVVTLADDIYTWSYGVFDWAENSFITSNYTVTVDTTIPAINVGFPSNNTYTNNTRLDVNYTVSDTYLDSCWYSNDTMSVNTTLVGCANITTLVWTEGQHNVTVWANDSAGNENSSLITFTIDTIYPSINITYPLNGSSLTDVDVDINYTVSDTNLDSCWYSNDTMSVNTTLASCANITSITWTEGEHNVTIWINDSVNYVNSSSVTFTIETKPPVLSFITPTLPNATTTSNTSIEINVSIVEENLDSLTYNWNGTNFTMYNDSLVLMYNFDNVSALGENDTYVVDVSGNGNDGTLFNTVFNQTSRYDKGITFDGSSGNITIDNEQNFDFERTDSFSGCFWINFDTIGDNVHTPLSKLLNSGTYSGWELHTWDSTTGTHAGDAISLYVVENWGDNKCIFASAENVLAGTAGNWQHICFTYDGSSTVSGVKLYQDGVSQTVIDSAAWCTTPPSGSVLNNIPLLIGERETSGNTLDGTMDEVRIWNRTLSADEVYQQYASNLNKFNTTQWYLYVNQSKNATTGLSNGNYTYQISANNTLGNANSTEQRTVTIDYDNIAPNIAIDSPINGTTYNSTSVDLNWSVNEDISWCAYSLDGAANDTSITTGGSGETITLVYNATGNEQNFTVPVGVTSIDVKVWGAGGGGGWYSSDTYSWSGGAGGFSNGTVSVTPGEILKIIVGTGGANTSSDTGNGIGGYLGGGNGTLGDASGAGGGGLSGIFVESVTQSNAIIIAGGGGGSTGYYPGGSGGGLIGGSCKTDTTRTSSGCGASGNQTSGGSSNANGADGSALLGGNGDLTGYLTSGSADGGGGGSGYFGGEGGISDASGGGGGSGYLNASRISNGNTSLGENSTNSNFSNPEGINDLNYTPNVGIGGWKDRGGNGSIVIIYTSSSGVIPTNKTLTSLSDGNHSIIIYCNDTSGNNNNSENVSFSINTIDTVNPTFTNISNVTIEVGNALGYNINATDTSGVSCFTVNDTTNFKINCSGYLENNTALGVALYNLNITVNDTFGNENYVLMWVNVTDLDSTYPTWSGNKTNLTTNTSLGSSVYFNITLSDSNPNEYIFSWYNGTAWTNDSSASYTNGQEVSVNKTLNINDGNINWTWYFNDTIGNINQTEIWGIIIDTFYPLFSSYVDNNGTINNSGVGMFNVTVANTNGTVLLEVNGTNVTATDMGSNVYNANHSFTTNGTYSYKWYSWGNGSNANNNVSSTQNYVVNYVDTFYPLFSSYVDNNGTINNSGVGMFNVTVANTNGTVLLEVNGTNVTATDMGSNIYNANHSFVTNGTYSYKWYSWGNGSNTNNNVSSTQNYVVNYVDAFYPLFSSYVDNNGTINNSGVGMFNVTVANTNGTVLLEVNGTNVTATDMGSNVYNANHSFTTNGTYSYKWYSWGNGSNANNNVSSTQNYVVNYVDVTPPQVNITYPLTGTTFNYSTNSTFLNVTTNENSTCVYSLNAGVNNNSMSSNNTNTGHYINLNISSGTSYTTNVYCNDTNDNWNTTELISFSVDASPEINLDWIYPLTNISVSQNSFFNVTVNISCTTANCGEINVSLDPTSSTFYNFTTCDQTGATGPSQAQCDTNYTGTTLADLVTVGNGIQNWTVPTTGNYRIIAYGAEGGIGYINRFAGGKGAMINGTFKLTAGDVLQIVVGQMGIDGGSSESAGGGGGSFVYTGEIGTGNLLIAAGGGGGGGEESTRVGYNGSATLKGISASGETGTAGEGGNSNSYGTGGAGWNSDGINGGGSGNEGTRWDGGAQSGNTGAGGFGGGASGEPSDGGGGGGGYSGGSGSTSSTKSTWGGGGAGSFNNGTNQVNSTGINSGHGLVLITPIGSVKNGLILMNTSATPFYTNITNPYNLTLNENESQLITWWVNATGDINIPYEFFIYANKTEDFSIGNATSILNITIKDTTAPVVNITYPINTVYATDVTDLNYTYVDFNGEGNCWYSNSSGEWNSTLVVAGINFTGVTTINGINNFTIYCNDSSGNLNSSYITFTKKIPQIILNLVNPTTNVNVFQNEFFNVAVNVSCYNNDCGEINVSLDPKIDRTPRTCSEVWGASCEGKDPLTSDYSYDGCSAGSYYSNGFWVDEVTVDATTVAIGDNITITCDFDCYSTSSLNDLAIMYYNGTWNKIWRQDGSCTDGNYSTSVIISGEIGTQKARCSIGYYNYPNDAANDICFDTTYSDNDDVNFTVISAGNKGLILMDSDSTPFYTITQNPYNLTLNENESQLITWSVNATGSIDDTYEFFVYANKTSDLSINNLTSIWNVTIISSNLPTIDFVSPTTSPGSLIQDYIVANVSASTTNFANLTVYLYNSSGLYNSTNTSSSDYYVTFSNLPDGTYYLNATTVNTFGVENNVDTKTIILDNVAPSLELVSLIDKYNTSSTSLEFTFIATEGSTTNCSLYSDQVGSVNYILRDNNNSISSGITTTLNSSNFGERTHNWYITCIDVAGNINTSSTRQFAIDNSSPSITISSPVDSSSAGSIVYIYTEISDSLTSIDQASYTIYNGSGLNYLLSTGSLNSSNNWDAIWNSSSYGEVEMNLTLVVSANDSVGNSISSSVNFYLDNVNPVIQLIEPSELLTYYSNNFSLNSVVQDLSLNYTNYSISSSGSVVQQNSSSYDTSTTSHTWNDLVNVDGFSDGYFNLTIFGKDTSSNSKFASTLFIVDNTQPGFSLHSPNNLYSNSDSVLFNFTAVDNISSTLRCNLSIGGNTPTIYCTNSSSCNYTLTGFSDLLYDYNLTCKDNASNVVEYSSNITIDTTNPVIEFTSQTSSGNLSQNYIVVNVSVVDTNLDTVTINLYNSVGALINTSSGSSNSLFVNFTNLGEGDYFLNSTSNDSAENLGSSSTRMIVLDSTNPNNTLNATGTNLQKNVDSVTINWSSLDNNLNTVIFNITSPNQGLLFSSSTSSGEITLTTSNLTAIGSYLVSLYSIDYTGNYNLTTLSILVNDTSAPTIQVINPMSGNYSQNWIFVNATATDADINSIDIYLYNSTLGLITQIGGFSSLNSNNFTSLSDGTYYYNVSVCDASQCNASETYTVLLDTTLPEIEFTDQTSSGNLSQNYIIVNVSVVEQNLANVYSYLYNSTKNLVNTTITNSNSLFVNLTNLTDGTYYLNSTAVDSAGNSLSTTTTIIVLDVTNPNNTLTVNDTNLEKSVESMTINWSSLDDNLNLVIFNVTLPNQALLFNSSASSGELTLTPDNLTTIGTYLISLYSIDNAGNSNLSNLTFIVNDTLVPPLELINPMSGNYARNWIFVNTTSTDENVNNIDIYLYNSSSDLIEQSSGSSSPHSNNFTSLSEGTYYYNTSVCDTNQCNNSQLYTVILDTSGPTVTLNSPEDNYINSSFNSVNITFNCSATDSLGLANLSLYLTNSQNTGFTLNQSTSLSGTLNSTTWALNLSAGNYSWNCLSSDLLGNVQYSSENRSVWINFTDFDQDGIRDEEDLLEGEESNVDTEGVTNLNITVGGNSTYGTYDDTRTLIFYDGNAKMINFTHNFTKNQLLLNSMKIIKNENYLIVNLSGQLQSEYNKTLYLANNNFVTLCVKDTEISSISEISTNCDGVNETDLTSCLTTNITVGYDNATNITNLIGCDYDNNTFTVSNLRYSAIRGTVPETPSGSTSSSSGGGSSSGGSSGGGGTIFVEPGCTANSDCNLNQYCFENECYDAECVDDSVCNVKEGETCWNHRCVKLFDMEILEFESPVYIGDFFNFTYFLKGMADFNDDVEIKFWIEKDNNKITSGQDTIYLGSFEEKTKTKKLFLPNSISSGDYMFYIEVTYGQYTASAHRTIGIVVDEGKATITPISEPLTDSSHLISGFIVIAALILFVLFFFERKKIRQEFAKEKKLLKKYKISILALLSFVILGILVYNIKWFGLFIGWVIEVVSKSKFNISFIIYYVLSVIVLLIVTAGLIYLTKRMLKSKKLRSERIEPSRLKIIINFLRRRRKDKEELRIKKLKECRKIVVEERKLFVEKEKRAQKFRKNICKFFHDYFGMFKTKEEKENVCKAKKRGIARREAEQLSQKIKEETRKSRERRERIAEKKRIHEAIKRRKQEIRRNRHKFFHDHFGMFKTKEEKETIRKAKKRGIARGEAEQLSQQIKEETRKSRKQRERIAEKKRVIEAIKRRKQEVRRNRRKFFHDNFGMFKTEEEKELLRKAKEQRITRKKAEKINQRKKKQTKKSRKRRERLAEKKQVIEAIKRRKQEVRRNRRKFFHDHFGMFKTEEEKENIRKAKEQRIARKVRQRELKIKHKKDKKNRARAKKSRKRRERIAEKKRVREAIKRRKQEVRRNRRKFFHDHFGMFKTAEEKENIRKAKEQRIARKVRQKELKIKIREEKRIRKQEEARQKIIIEERLKQFDKKRREEEKVNKQIEKVKNIAAQKRRALKEEERVAHEKLKDIKTQQRIKQKQEEERLEKLKEKENIKKEIERQKERTIKKRLKEI